MIIAMMLMMMTMTTAAMISHDGHEGCMFVLMDDHADHDGERKVEDEEENWETRAMKAVRELRDRNVIAGKKVVFSRRFCFAPAGRMLVVSSPKEIETAPEEIEEAQDDSVVVAVSNHAVPRHHFCLRPCQNI